MNLSGWSRKPIAELCDFSGGYGFRPPDWSENGLPIIRIQNLNGSSNFNHFAGTPEADWLVQPGELLFAWAGTRGVSFGPTIWRGPLGVLNQHIYRVHPKPGVDKEWLYLALRVVTRRIEEKAHGFKSTLVHVRKSDIDNQVVSVPDERGQKRIADVVRCWEKSEIRLKRRIDLALERKRGLMQQLLAGKKRFKEFRGERWRTFKLGDLFSERVEIGRPDLPLVSITGQNGVVPRDSLAKRDTSSEDKSKYLRIAPGDIGYNTMRMWQGVSGLSKLEGIVSPAYTICTPSERINAHFAAHLFKHAPVVNLFRRYSQGLVDDTLALKFPNFAQIQVTIPRIHEQHRIARVLSTCDREIELLQRQSDALKEQKRGLMQKLLMGEMRVKNKNQR